MTKSCGGGRFVRDGRGIWRYGQDGQPVSGAQDMTMSNLFNFPVDRDVVSVQRGVAIENEILSWCLDYDTELGSTIEVPLDQWRRHDGVIGIWAPELMHEGGIRGMRTDAGDQSDFHDVWRAPIAPVKRQDIKRTALTLEKDLRRRGWVPQSSNGNSAYWEHWRSEQPTLSLAQYLKGYRSPEQSEAAGRSGPEKAADQGA
ncbi:MAG: hypothetical protein ACT4OM_02560 [Actinomycetota bacterium]